jgi:TolB protein
MHRACFVLLATLYGCAVSGPDASRTSMPLLPPAASAEPGLIQPTQLTFPDRFVKAGEAYFDASGRRVVFQAIERNASGEPESPHYAMYVADLAQAEAGDRAMDRAFALVNVRRVSPVGSANTCGWFDPRDPDTLYFASTVTPPAEGPAPGYQRDGRTYRWAFPPEMRIVKLDLRAVDGTAASLQSVTGDGKGYVAEGALSADGRTLLFTRLVDGEGDLFTLDLPTGEITQLVEAPGYDGGAFFSPDGSRIVWRGDRNRDNLLQLREARVRRDGSGRVTAVEGERPLTDDEHVNWAPYWTPDGSAVVYATSREGHRNYEVFAVDVPADDDPSLPRPRRVTAAEGADLLPAISPDGRLLMWTSQRGEDRSSQLWIARIGPDSPIGAASASPTSANP